MTSKGAYQKVLEKTREPSQYIGCK
jgi:hypothetical protein